MHVHRTPDRRFEHLDGFAFPPHYAIVPTPGDRSLRMHYLDEPPQPRPVNGPIVLLHGEPTWSYLYRTMIPALTSRGHRCIAPDLIGFGRSDKPCDRADYTYQRHVDWLTYLLFDHLQLDHITLSAQDWGGLIGLRIVAAHPDQFARVCVANTFLPTGDGDISAAFLAWQAYAASVPDLDIGRLVAAATTTSLTDAQVAAYDAPFENPDAKAGAAIFPALVPTHPDDPEAAANRRAWERLERFNRPFLCLYSDQDPITAGGDQRFRARIPGAAGQPHATIADAGHFLQEDQPHQLADRLDRWMRQTTPEP